MLNSGRMTALSVADAMLGAMEKTISLIVAGEVGIASASAEAS